MVIGAGPGLKFKKEEVEEETVDELKKRTRKLIGRIYVGYIFELPKEFEITPNANLDFTEGTKTKEVNTEVEI
ncbi:hypothetical protein [uncultured Legionella sp.]|uniref:hypothetical protein n=1 Tax=uncultured Legionella sp. TaxID=210934 RepID=UPI002609C76A|nr:hypothetical protein [uncultured Legionella sp.]